MTETPPKRINALDWLLNNPDADLYAVSQRFFPHDAPGDLHGASVVLVRNLLHAGAISVEVDARYQHHNQALDEIFVTIPNPLPKALLIEILDIEPDEFEEIKLNVFRVWWD